MTHDHALHCSAKCNVRADSSVPFWVLWPVIALYGRNVMAAYGRSASANGRPPLSDTLCVFKSAFPSGAAFHDGASPGPLDISIFGIMFPYAQGDPGHESDGFKVVRAALAAAGLDTWYAAVLRSFSSEALLLLRQPCPSA